MVGRNDILLYSIAFAILQINDILAAGICNAVVDKQIAEVLFRFGGETSLNGVVGQTVISPYDGVSNKDAVGQFFFKVIVDGDASDKRIRNLNSFDDGVISAFEQFVDGNFKLARLDWIGKV